MPFVLLPIPVVQLAVVPQHRRKSRVHGKEPAKRNLVSMKRNADFRCPVLLLGRKDLKGRLSPEKPIFGLRREHHGLDGGKDMPLLFLLRVAVVGKCVLQPAKLICRIARKTLVGTFGKEDIHMLAHEFSDISHENNMLRLGSKHLDGIGIAGGKQSKKFPKPIDHRIGFTILHLLERLPKKQ